MSGRSPHDRRTPAGQDPAPGPSSGPPDTIAVALAWEAPADADTKPPQAPTVVASGRGFVAEQILQIAFAEGVRVRADADLAQMLAAVDVDSEIPPEAFAAVAEILAYLYRANGEPDRAATLLCPPSDSAADPDPGPTPDPGAGRDRP